MAELVDALASGASDRMVVEVRVFSWAPKHRAVRHVDQLPCVSWYGVGSFSAPSTALVLTGEGLRPSGNSTSYAESVRLGLGG